MSAAVACTAAGDLDILDLDLLSLAHRLCYFLVGNGCIPNAASDVMCPRQPPLGSPFGLTLCSKIAETEAVVSVNEKKLLEMHMYMHVQLMQYELRGPPNPWLTVT